MNTINEINNGADDVARIPIGDIRAACDAILASDAFLNAPRMSRLLSYLVEKAIAGAVQDTCEYAVGIEVFDRDPSSYNTGKDPIVRVQAGRLRCRLKKYYASMGESADIEIVIPVGSYMPGIRRKNIADNGFKPQPMFVMHPFECVLHPENGEG